VPRTSRRDVPGLIGLEVEQRGQRSDIVVAGQGQGDPGVRAPEPSRRTACAVPPCGTETGRRRPLTQQTEPSSTDEAGQPGTTTIELGDL
jgi:hypothetical protein